MGLKSLNFLDLTLSFCFFGSFSSLMYTQFNELELFEYVLIKTISWESTSPIVSISILNVLRPICEGSPVITGISSSISALCSQLMSSSYVGYPISLKFLMM